MGLVLHLRGKNATAFAFLVLAKNRGPKYYP